jgi:hypothetical protein
MPWAAASMGAARLTPRRSRPPPAGGSRCADFCPAHRGHVGLLRGHPVVPHADRVWACDGHHWPHGLYRRPEVTASRPAQTSPQALTVGAGRRLRCVLVRGAESAGTRRGCLRM